MIAIRQILGRHSSPINNYCMVSPEFSKQIERPKTVVGPTLFIISKKNVKTGKVARVILFSTDLEIEWQNIIDYYRLIFQIEFNFRDAKQHWGLENFMVIKEQSVFNAANLSLWMANVSHAILARSGEKSILDLKARHHGLRYA